MWFTWWVFLLPFQKLDTHAVLSFCECDEEEPVLYSLTIICMKGRPAVCKLISGSNYSTVTGRISQSPCLGTVSWKAFLSSSSLVPRLGVEHEHPRLLAQGGSSSRGSHGEGFPLSSCGFLSPAVCPELFTLSLRTTHVSGRCGWRNPRQWCGRPVFLLQPSAF